MSRPLETGAGAVERLYGPLDGLIDPRVTSLPLPRGEITRSWPSSWAKSSPLERSVPCES
ncbi:hypothetical protein CP557_12445 [Natrinema ejinorense]|uniref:Uncharacterized protein n=1 Tax=Natrinema ejinorense TaxID=373386 RepID=A0A2A5QWV5_9EURY|nr:hypothetical protein CP557_12445 [Natrinema ejinorense]